MRITRRQQRKQQQQQSLPFTLLPSAQIKLTNTSIVIVYCVALVVVVVAVAVVVVRKATLNGTKVALTEFDTKISL